MTRVTRPLKPEKTADERDVLIRELRERLASAELALRTSRSAEDGGASAWTAEIETQYRAILDLVPAGACTIGSDGIVAYCSPGLSRVLGVPGDEIVGTKLLQYVAAHDREPFQRFLKRANDSPMRGEMRLFTVERGSISVRVVTSLVPAKNEARVWVVFMDISEWRAREEKLRRAQEASKQLADKRETRLRDDNMRLEKEAEERWQVEEELRVSNEELVVENQARMQIEEELRQRGEELNRSRTLLEAVLDGTPDPVYVKDGDSRVLLANRALGEVAGMPVDRIIGRTDGEYYRDAAVGQTLREHDLQVMRAGAGAVFEETVPTPVGMRTFLSSKVPYRSTAGEIIGIIGISRDITDRKAMEEALRESEERFRQLAEAGYEGLAVHDDNVLLDMNTRMAQMAGYAVSELVGQPFLQYVDPLYRDKVQQNVADESQALYEIELIHRDGHRVPVEIMARPIIWRGRPARLAALRDITERKKAEAEVRESAEHFAALVNASSEVVYRMSRDWSEMRRLTSKGFIQDMEHPDRDWADKYIHPDDQPHVSAEIRKAIEAKSVFTLEHRVRRVDGSLGWTLTRAVPILDDRGEISEWFGTASDITDRKLYEERIQRQKQELERLVAERTEQIRKLERQRHENEKQAAIGQMAARIAHEINNPLAGVKNSFRLVRKDIPPNSRHYRFVALVDKELDRIARIVRQMFEVYKPERRAPSKVDIRATVSDVETLLEGNARSRGVRIGTDMSEVSDAVELHEDSVRQILFCLLQNAIEASVEGGKVHVMVSLHEDTLVLSVTDDGCGIPSEVGGKIFEPFFTTKGELTTGGLGLGLSITKGVVEAMGGVISYESEMNKGTTFQVVLPVHQTNKES